MQSSFTLLTGYRRHADGRQQREQQRLDPERVIQSSPWQRHDVPVEYFLSLNYYLHTHSSGERGGEGERWGALGCTHSGGETKRADTHRARARTFVSEDQGEPVCHRVRKWLDRHLIVGLIVRVSPIGDTSPTGGPGMRCYVALRYVELRYRRGYGEKNAYGTTLHDTRPRPKHV